MTPSPTLDPVAAQAVSTAANGLVNMFLLFALSWFVFAWICSKMARSRGRNASSGAVAGFIFGPLAVIYYLIVGQTTEARVRAEEAVRQKLRSESPSVEMPPSSTTPEASPPAVVPEKPAEVKRPVRKVRL